MNELEGYTLGKTASSKATRSKKARKILRVLNQYTNVTTAHVLEIGTGAGYIAHALSKEAKRVDSVDIVDDRQVKTGYHQTLVKDETLPFGDKQFDIVITNHVLEHVPDQRKHFAEIRRVLKDDGVMYLASPNKWWVTDPHYKLPFISWLSRPLASKYLAMTKGRKWDIYSVSLRRLHTLARTNHFTVIDVVSEVLSHPATYELNLPDKVGKIAQLTPGFIKKLLLYVVPTHIKVLKPLHDDQPVE